MGWTVIVLLWLVYPVVGTIAIIVLGILNQKYKQQINDLLEQMQIQNAAKNVAKNAEKNVQQDLRHPDAEIAPDRREGDVEQPQTPLISKTVAAPLPSVPLPSVLRPSVVPQLLPPPSLPPEPKRNKIQVHPGLASLIIGVIFVVIAGLIFATTNWQIMPDIYKVFMVLAFAGLFFITSRIAEKRMRIERTGRAFYILGSIFLFLAVLAAGYFQLLGPGFVLEGPGRWWVLWAGSVVTEIAFITGFRKYQERIFTLVYLGGLTVSVTFLMAALRNHGVGFAYGMVCYAFVLLAAGYINHQQEGNRDCGFFPKHVSAVWKTFSAVNFVLAAGLMLPHVLFGFEAVFGDSCLNAYRITPWSILCVGLIAAGTAILAFWENGRRGYLILYRLAAAVFLQYTAMGMPVETGYQLLLAAALHGAWFVLGRKFKLQLQTETGDGILTGAAAVNTAILFMNALWDFPGYVPQITASAAIVILVGMAVLWSRQYSGLKRGILYLLALLTFTLYGICRHAGLLEIRYHHILFAYVMLAAAWDILKKDDFCIDILVMGVIPQVAALIWGVRTSPFLFLLSAYLFIKIKGRTGRRECQIFRISCICALAGAYLELCWWLPNPVLAMLAVAALLVVEYLIASRWNEMWKRDWFWDAAASGVFVALMTVFYRSEGMEPSYLAVCLVLFFLFYGKAYLGCSTWAHLPMVLVMMPLPWHTALFYDFTENQILAVTAAVVLVSGISFRLCGPIHKTSEDGEHTLQVDWYHMLIGPVLIVLSGSGGRIWESVYTLLLILYVLQYAMLEGVRKIAFTAAMVLGAWLWWRQAFFAIPDVIRLEMSLLPAVAFAAMLSRIWGETAAVNYLRTGIQAACLILLTWGAFLTGDVADALILEILCLGIFLMASKRDSRRWKQGSGAVMVLVALYMTKWFWLSLSWWVYLLAAGIGLIGFAAWNEMKRR